MPGGGYVRTHSYQITIAGPLGDIYQQEFGDFRIEATDANAVLSGDLDQAALQGTLSRILWLGLDLVEVRRLPSSTGPRCS
jgi:hypothetical protein